MRSRFLRFAVPLLLMGLVAAACSNNDDNSGASGATGETGASGSTGGAVECNADIKVGVAFDVGGLGDKSFNDARQRRSAEGDRRRSRLRGERGHERGQRLGFGPHRERAGARRRRLQPGRRRRVRVLARHQHDLAGLPGHQLHDRGRVRHLRHRVRARQRRLHPNVADFVFKEQEGSFLVGAAAALKCQCDTIGFLGGQTGPLIQKFEAGYTAGAKAVTRTSRSSSSTSAMTWARSTTRSRARRSRPRCTTTARRSSTTRRVHRARVSSTRPSRRTSWPSGSTRTST